MGLIRLLGFIGLIGVLSAGIATGFLINLGPVADKNTAAEETLAEFVVKPGDGLRTIATGLNRAQLIKSERVFQLLNLFSGSAHRLKPGRYQISPSWGAPRIRQLLVAGPPVVTVTIAEGETLGDIDQKLSGLGIIGNEELINFSWQHLKYLYPFLKDARSLEGFLFPDTYRFAQFSPVDIIVKEFLNNFKDKVWPILAKSQQSYYNKLVVASLLEKEMPSGRERALVAGIIEKRLRLAMPLQVDASVTYDKCQRRFLTCDARTRKIYRRDLTKDSRYNTYRYLGLPPTPIANPGVDAIQAALRPVTSPYLYYLSDQETGKTIFAVTLDEHNDNRVKYLNL